MPRHKIQIVCHMGARYQAPENTFAGVRLCVDWGMDYVEVDVRTSRDGVLYLMHDPTVDRTTNGSGQFAEMTSAEIDRLEAGSWFGPQYAGEHVPRLEPLLRWIKGKAGVYFDAKCVEPQRLIDLVYDVGMEHDSYFYSGSEEWYLELHRLDPRLAIEVDVTSVADVVKAHERFGARIVTTKLCYMSEAFVAACRERSLQFMIYEGSCDPEVFRQSVAWNPDMFCTDYGDLFSRFLAEQSL